MVIRILIDKSNVLIIFPFFRFFVGSQKNVTVVHLCIGKIATFPQNSCFFLVFVCARVKCVRVGSGQCEGQLTF